MYIFGLPFVEGLEIYNQAREQLEERLLWDMWLINYQHMTKDNYVSFEQFKITAKTSPAIKRSEKEILQDAEDILKSMGKTS